MKSLRKGDFATLLKYLMDSQRKHERVGDIVVTHCQSHRPDVAITEILNTQAQNKRAGGDKTYHLIVSFRAGEQPDPTILKLIEAALCDGLGFGRHQRISVAHHDTDHFHLHIAINKIHPTRYTIHHPYCDYQALGQLCEKLERQFGLEQDNHQFQKRGAENRAADMEHQAGMESLLGWIRRECHAQILGAQSWSELHQVMRANGLDLHGRGNGLVITANDGTTVKASSVSRECSKGRLEAKLGSFVAAPAWYDNEQVLRRYEQRPMRSRLNTDALYASYQSARHVASELRSDALSKARNRKKRLIEDAKRSGRLKRAAIKFIDASRLSKKIMYSATSKTLLTEIEKINQQYFAQRQEINAHCRRQTWADWLRTKAVEGDQAALQALRERNTEQGIRSDALSGKNEHRSAVKHLAQDGVTKKGTIIYWMGTSAVRDDGDRLNIARGADQVALQAALKLAIERFGDCICVNGTNEFKEEIGRVAVAARLALTFENAKLEYFRQQLLQTALIKENEHEHEQPIHITPRQSTGGGIDGAESAAIRPGATRTAGNTGKSDAGNIGRNPPPASQNCLRKLSELGVVRIASGSAVLLPRDVLGHLEQQGTTADNPLRRRIPGNVAGWAAAEKYIVERGQTRGKGIDIPQHIQYDFSEGTVVFAGIRNVDGQILALLKQRDVVMVLPLDDASAQRFKRCAIGDTVSVNRYGMINGKGRSR